MSNRISLFESISAALMRLSGGKVSPPPPLNKIYGRFVGFLPEKLRPLYGLVQEKEKELVSLEIQKEENHNDVVLRNYLEVKRETRLVRALFRAEVLQFLGDLFRLDELSAIEAGRLDFTIRASWEVVLLVPEDVISRSLATG